MGFVFLLNEETPRFLRSIPSFLRIFAIVKSAVISECHDKRIGQGQYVLLDFWASWCGPCLDEIPNVIRLNNLFAGKGLRILGVTVRDQPDHSKAAISEMKNNYDQIFDLEGIISARYSVEGVPHFFLLDPQGNVALQGHHNLDEFEQYLQKNL